MCKEFPCVTHNEGHWRQYHPGSKWQPQVEMKIEATLAGVNQGCSKRLLRITLILCLWGGYVGTLGTLDGWDQLGLYSVFAIAGNSGNISSGSTHKTSAQVIVADHSNVNVQRIKNDQNYTMEGKRTGEVEEIIPAIAKALKWKYPLLSRCGLHSKLQKQQKRKNKHCPTF